jgi:putative spermidine/putrescine transport system ATP-binding protein
MEHVVFEGVRKVFGDHVAIDELNLSIARGEFLTLLGPSGCGKSTTLRILAGFLAPDAGRILVGGRDITAVPANKRDNGIVFQGYALFPHMTVAQNVAFGLEMRRVIRSDIERRVMRALEMVRLAALAERLPRQLSGGQQQRVALARAIVIEPSVLLLDEPLSALDAKLRVEVRNDIRSLQKTLNLTTIFVTHDQEEALSLSDRIVVMNNGIIQQAGTPREIYQDSRTRFVASFIGNTNFLEGETKDGIFITNFGAKIEYRNARPSDRYNLISVRPEAISLAAQANGAASGNCLPGTVKEIEYLGSMCVVTLDVADGYTMTVHLAGPSSMRIPMVGESVSMRWASADTAPLDS